MLAGARTRDNPPPTLTHIVGLFFEYSLLSVIMLLVPPSKFIPKVVGGADHRLLWPYTAGGDDAIVGLFVPWNYTAGSKPAASSNLLSKPAFHPDLGETRPSIQKAAKHDVFVASGGGTHRPRKKAGRKRQGKKPAERDTPNNATNPPPRRTSVGAFLLAARRAAPDLRRTPALRWRRN